MQKIKKEGLTEEAKMNLLKSIVLYNAKSIEAMESIRVEETTDN